jgi:wyosine [tRNA(Phe)-imidazoG37] synthetase (radical SAM superfamily)
MTPMDQPADKQNLNRTTQAAKPYAEHSRHWEAFTYVYPVVSRRSKGLSIGVNLNPDTICNFDCVYCQVDKIEHPRPMQVDTVKLRKELEAIVADAVSGRLWEHPRFAGVDQSLRRLNDIAFSGDGEPTAAACFADAVNIAVAIKKQHKLDGVKLVVITNATLLDRPGVESALCVLHAHGGEVWAKLDAGTQAYYEKIDRSAVPLQRVLDNLLACGRRRPIVIQSMFLKMHGEPVPAEEFDAYADRLAELIEAGCQIKLVQLYTVARDPLESYVSALDDTQLPELARRLRCRLGGVAGCTDLVVEVFGSHG